MRFLILGFRPYNSHPMIALLVALLLQAKPEPPRDESVLVPVATEARLPNLAFDAEGNAYVAVVRNGNTELAISTDGGPSRHFPSYTVETNQRTRMGLEPKVTPAVVLWDAAKSRAIPVGYGVMSADELQDRIYLLTSKEAGRDY